jgi:acetylornithine deacetylase/succinyl-diaminopimelate desuccinylase-like protein
MQMSRLAVRRTLALCAGFAVCLSVGRAVAQVAPPNGNPRQALQGNLGLNVAMGLPLDAKLASILTEVDARRLRAMDSTLVSFGTRHTFSDTLSSTRGIGAARRRIKAQFDRFSADCGNCLRVWFDDSVQVQTPNPVNIVNVVAMLPGRDTSRVIVITGHYASCLCSAGAARDGAPDAPGANDDGSGTVAIMELARVISKNYPRGLEASVVFATVAAEEQGLWGSRQLAARLYARGYTIVAGISNDIVGNVTAEDG